MSKRLIGIVLILLLALASSGADKKKKAYELIYEDVQLLRQQFLQLKKKIEKNNEDIGFIKEQLEELLNMVKHLQTEQASFKEDQKKIPTQYQIVLEKLETMTLQLIKFSRAHKKSPPRRKEKRIRKQRNNLENRQKKKKQRKKLKKSLNKHPQLICLLQKSTTWLILIIEKEISSWQ
jgi:chromosome segregation ATPase